MTFMIVHDLHDVHDIATMAQLFLMRTLAADKGEKGSFWNSEGWCIRS
jgi:hypothetical protein